MNSDIYILYDNQIDNQLNRQVNKPHYPICRYTTSLYATQVSPAHRFESASKHSNHSLGRVYLLKSALHTGSKVPASTQSIVQAE